MIIAIVVFIFAGVFFWRLLRILFWLVQIAAFIAGIVVGLDTKANDGFFRGLVVGTLVYLLILSMVLMWNRVINLEREVVRLGGKPNTPLFMDWARQWMVTIKAKNKNQV